MAGGQYPPPRVAALAALASARATIQQVRGCACARARPATIMRTTTLVVLAFLLVVGAASAAAKPTDKVRGRKARAQQLPSEPTPSPAAPAPLQPLYPPPLPVATGATPPTTAPPALPRPPAPPSSPPIVNIATVYAGGLGPAWEDSSVSPFFKKGSLLFFQERLSYLSCLAQLFHQECVQRVSFLYFPSGSARSTSITRARTMTRPRYGRRLPRSEPLQ